MERVCAVKKERKLNYFFVRGGLYYSQMDVGLKAINRDVEHGFLQ